MTYENRAGKMSLGSDMTITYKTANGYVTTSNVYEYGLVLDTWWPFAWIAGNQGGFGGTIITVSLTAPLSKYVSSPEDRSGAQG